MFNRFAKLFRTPEPAPAPITWPRDIPEHKGFRATVTLPNGGFMRLACEFSTLKEAQVYIAQVQFDANRFARAIGRDKPARRIYKIRNLETGKFAPYKWSAVSSELSYI